jgi:hypothetical protein
MGFLTVLKTAMAFGKEYLSFCHKVVVRIGHLHDGII